MLAYFIWNGSPEIFSYGSIALRWYGLLFALGFLVSQQILYYMFKKEGKPEKEVDSLTILMVIATIIGARLGHVIFYQPELFKENLVGVFLPVEFREAFSWGNLWGWLKSIRFTGFLGLASHGGAIAILLGLWWYARKRKLSYLHVLDRIVILVALTGAFIRMGNYFNSEIIGKPTDSFTGVVFANRFTDGLQEVRGYATQNPVESLTLEANPAGDTVQETGSRSMVLYVFTKPDLQEDDMRSFVEGRVKGELFRNSEFFKFNHESPLNYNYAKQDNGGYALKIPVTGIARHPAQLYESISCLILFGFLFWIWKKHGANPPEGRIFGLFLVILWGLRFSYEFLKEPQVDFETTMALNMGQILSIPLFIAGIWVLWRSYRLKPETSSK